MAALFEFDGANVLQARYTHGPGVDEPLVMARDANGDGVFGAGERFVYHRDGLGSVVQLTDEAGSVARAYGYDAYGRIVDETGSVANPYTYTGRERDGESGLYFYRARYYDPATGRFLSEDPIGFGAGDGNLYRYVFNNSVGLRDPDGRVAPILVGCLIGAGAGAFGAFYGEGFAQIGEKIAEGIRDARNAGSNAGSPCGNPKRRPIRPPVESFGDFLDTPLGEGLKAAAIGAGIGCLAGTGFPALAATLGLTEGAFFTGTFMSSLIIRADVVPLIKHGLIPLN